MVIDVSLSTQTRAHSVVLNLSSVIQIEIGLGPAGKGKKRGWHPSQFYISVSKVREKPSRRTDSSPVAQGPTYHLLYLVPKPNQLPLSMACSCIFLPLSTQSTPIEVRRRFCGLSTLCQRFMVDLADMAIPQPIELWAPAEMKPGCIERESISFLGQTAVHCKS